MFDIGFFELLLICVVFLVVVGPERLPGAIRSTLKIISRFKDMASQARKEVEEQVGIEEIKQDLHNEKVLKSIQRLRALQSQSEAKLEDWEDEFELSPSHKHDKPETSTPDTDTPTTEQPLPTNTPPHTKN